MDEKLHFQLQRFDYEIIIRLSVFSSKSQTYIRRNQIKQRSSNPNKSGQYFRHFALNRDL